jgi:alginate O-acetyltransferase complex protein AlgI
VNKFSPALYKYLTKIHLPLGISFYTFQSISYLVDIYLGEIRAQRNIIDFAMYKTFFPQLVAGPIVRYKDIIPYIKQRSFSWRVFSSGIDRFIYGLASKAILANSMGSIANDVFSVEKADLGFYEAWIGIICYSLQIYFDFSGYSSMAIGMAKMFGFEFKENFNYPYSAPSITDFWRRWHISLSSWFKDYIYIPLGGNRCSEIRKIVNLYVVFFLCGLWHGASWNFIVWGLWHGSLLVIEKFFIKFNSKIINYTPRFCSSIYVFLVVMIGWVFFRSDDLNQAVSYLGSMFFYKEILSFKFQLIMIKYFNFKYLLLFVISIAMLFPLKFHSYYLIQEDKSSLDCAMLSKITVKLALLIYSLLSLAGSSFNPFIYFRF